MYGGINEGTATVTLPDLSEENVEDRKTFVGWYSDIDCTTPVGGGAVQKEIAMQLTDSNAKYYAGWDAASYMSLIHN
ncbi:MAG: hypothetical protein LUD73_07030 [Lachnospiraceae bacterium]|nr:hypothetical protein [Lachnospiraceae bacterium]